MDSTYLNYLIDSLRNIIDRSIKVDPTKDEFNKGVQFGYYEVLSHLFNQAENFDILEDLGEYLKNFNPDDILNGKAQNPFEKKSSNNETDQCS